MRVPKRILIQPLKIDSGDDILDHHETWSRLCEYLEGVIVQFDDLKGWEGDPIAQYERDECRRVNALDLIALGANG